MVAMLIAYSNVYLADISGISVRRQYDARRRYHAAVICSNITPKIIVPKLIVIQALMPVARVARITAPERTQLAHPGRPHDEVRIVERTRQRLGTQHGIAVWYL